MMIIYLIYTYEGIIKKSSRLSNYSKQTVLYRDQHYVHKNKQFDMNEKKVENTFKKHNMILTRESLYHLAQ